ncbi:Gfo/Idh/MocA family protein [Rhodopirellula halodulae]|uniref:Gfo/Idh/MocA family protein n=1 Tax=Rhodopirellula halodulae TaxID=2894198 RepID=UPI001E34C4AB|nr:Gfo/Idh/MocA family oxidoreductase [Rhodopirellula sp. JC737]MCC9657705.1 Gfo/Idh/MocA family oxidoreductase [Rhodopirellula sp. JC737]
MDTRFELLAANQQRDRRLFLKAGAAMGMAAITRPVMADASASTSPNETIRVGVMGVNNRGAALAKGFVSNPDTDVVAICDVDSRALDRVVKQVSDTQANSPKRFVDVRKMLDEAELDAIVVAAPNHWHAPATILGCAAGKHVYVEKPCSQTAEEGELAVQAARKHNRVVQMGSQRRSWPAIQQAIELVHSGGIGKVSYSRTWYNNRRPSIGHGQSTSVPSWLNWDLWQGPAPRKEYVDNVVHYNWHWRWHWGNGELGNNGIHMLDLARWGLQVTTPNRVRAGGGKYRHEDDQQTPDTMMVTYDFPENKTATWEGLSWSPLGPHDAAVGVSFHGTEGSIVLRGNGFTRFDERNKEVETVNGEAGDATHLADFVDAIQNGRHPNADILEAHRSTLLCHLGNIAYRTGNALEIDSTTGKPVGNDEALSMWGREYEPGWKPVIG